MDDDQRLSRQQAERVLGRAATLALARRDDDDTTLGELREAAEAAGLDGALVRQAATELALDVLETPRRYGMQTRVVRRRLLARRLSGEALVRLMVHLDALFGARGTRELQGESATWAARHIYVTVLPQRDGSLVQVSERFVYTATSMGNLGIALGGALGLVLGALLGLQGAAALTMLPLAVFTGWLGLLLARLRHARRITETGVSFERALDAIERAALAAAPEDE